MGEWDGCTHASRQKVWREAATRPKVACRCLPCPGACTLLLPFGDLSLRSRHIVAAQKAFAHRPALTADWTISPTSNQADPPPPQVPFKKISGPQTTSLFPSLLLSKQHPLVRQIAIRSFHTERFAPFWRVFFHFQSSFGRKSPDIRSLFANGLRKRAAIEALRLISALPSSSSVLPSPAHHTKVGLVCFLGEVLIFQARGPTWTKI